jgi:DNA helicase-2/ATP-dependent DNA helicase PcrA
MDVTPILESLNEAQREAVTAPSGPLLVIAGAGSGKTRVLTHRAAWLIDVEGISPQSLLAVTFTNKAAAEMRGRIESLLQMPVNHLWIGTFHGLAHRLLRRHWQDAGLPQNFQIIDADDQLRIQKDEGLRPQHLDDERDSNRRQFISLYQSYQEICDRGGLVDFAELLLRAHELWRDRPEILQHYQKRFKHLLVDEFQDTNAIQYAWLRLLAGKEGIPFVVGDDDQSIYRWRGARVEHIDQFQKDFPGTSVVKLEQNYRSTATILNAANAVIANNDSRMGKNLWTEGDTGEAIRIYSAYNERDEADFVVGAISRVRRTQIFRTRRNQGRTGLSAPDRESRRRFFLRAHCQPAGPGHRRANRFGDARLCAGKQLHPVACGRGHRQRRPRRQNRNFRGHVSQSHRTHGEGYGRP